MRSLVHTIKLPCPDSGEKGRTCYRNHGQLGVGQTGQNAVVRSVHATDNFIQYGCMEGINNMLNAQVRISAPSSGQEGRRGALLQSCRDMFSTQPCTT
jgi:hypothetical protein